jgi:hypothetical protein
MTLRQIPDISRASSNSTVICSIVRAVGLLHWHSQAIEGSADVAISIAKNTITLRISLSPYVKPEFSANVPRGRRVLENLRHLATNVGPVSSADKGVIGAGGKDEGN